MYQNNNVKYVNSKIAIDEIKEMLNSKNIDFITYMSIKNSSINNTKCICTVSFEDYFINDGSTFYQNGKYYSTEYNKNLLINGFTDEQILEGTVKVLDGPAYEQFFV